MKKQIINLTLGFVLLLLLWLEFDYIPQMLTMADTLVNILGMAAIFVSIFINSIIILKLKQINKKQTT